jgi:hypothetical protein
MDAFLLRIAENLQWIESRKAGATESERRALEKARAELDQIIDTALSRCPVTARSSLN